jgi:hypothetical protein
MTRHLDHLREQALRARWWALSVPNPSDRERFETIAREYEQEIRAAERDDRRSPLVIGRGI